jgi:hypothetical protein
MKNILTMLPLAFQVALGVAVVEAVLIVPTAILVAVCRLLAHL